MAPSIPLPLSVTLVCADARASCSTASANGRSRKIIRAARTSTDCSLAPPPSPLPAKATHPVESITPTSPRTLIPGAPGANGDAAPKPMLAAIGWSLRSRARIRITSPSCSVISPCSTGSAAVRSSPNASPGGLRSGSGRVSMVPTRSLDTRSCEGGCCLPRATGTRTPMRQALLPDIHGLSHARSA